MPFDYFKLLKNLEDKAPQLSNALSIKLIGLVSPFNSHLRAKVISWDDTKAVLEVKLHRGVKNHIGGIHAGAIFTLGETCAGLLIVRNFNFKDYRPIMSEVSVSFSKQARGAIRGTASLAQSALGKVRRKLNSSGVEFIDMQTVIENQLHEVVAVVKTKWQIKAWDQIKKKR